MIKLLKKICVYSFVFMILGLNFSWADAPSYTNTYGENLRGTSSVFDLHVRSKNTLQQNIKDLFYPSRDGGQVWTALRIIGVGAFIFFIIRGGSLFLLNAYDEAKQKQAKLNLAYLLYGALLYFGALWIMGNKALNFVGLSGLEGKDNSFVGVFESGLMINILGFLKALAFFFAIVMLVWYGFGMMKAYSREEKVANARKGAINVIVALVLIKLIDYIYYIASVSNFTERASELITTLSAVMGYVLGIMLVFVIIFAGIQLVASRGQEEAWTRTKSVLKTVFLVVFIIFLFLLIIHQVLTEVTV